MLLTQWVYGLLQIIVLCALNFTYKFFRIKYFEVCAFLFTRDSFNNIFAFSDKSIPEDETEPMAFGNVA